MWVFLSKTVTRIGGTLYPAYRSFKAVRTKNIREYVKWMMYWIVYAVWLNVEVIADVILGFWMPFYYEAKVLFMLWLISPYTRGASMLYRKFIHPLMIRHEEEIDAYLDQAKRHGYTALMDIGSRGITYAREIVAVAAFKGQLHLAKQLRKSYSVNDLALSGDEDQADGNGEEQPRNWEGYCDDGSRIVEEEFQYLYTEDGASSSNQPHMRQTRRSATVKTAKISGYSTLPRRSRRRDGGI